MNIAHSKPQSQSKLGTILPWSRKRQRPVKALDDVRRPWFATHRHKKGGLYRVVGHGVLEADRAPAVIYDDAEGNVWIRDAEEFYDGRFTKLTS